MEKKTIKFAPRQKLPHGFLVQWFGRDKQYHYTEGEKYSMPYATKWEAYRAAWDCFYSRNVCEYILSRFPENIR
jgi:hypothetical protein